jgi:hypothetical protein
MMFQPSATGPNPSTDGITATTKRYSPMSFAMIIFITSDVPP